MALPRHRIGVLVLLGAGLFGGAAAVAEPLLGLPNSFTALGAPWLVCAFAVGSLLPGRRRAAIAGALLLSGATGVYYGAQVYGYGLDSMQYATTMAAAWGVTAGFAGAVLALAGSVWRGAGGLGAAVLAAVPAAALAGEAVLLSSSWSGTDAAGVVGAELAAAAALVVVLSRRRAAVWSTTAGVVLLTVVFALVEAELRGYMRAAGWHGA